MRGQITERSVSAGAPISSGRHAPRRPSVERSQGMRRSNHRFRRQRGIRSRVCERGVVMFWLLSAVEARRLRLSCFVVFDVLAFAQVRALKFRQCIFGILVISNAGFSQVLLDTLPCAILGVLLAKLYGDLMEQNEGIPSIQSKYSRHRQSKCLGMPASSGPLWKRSMSSSSMKHGMHTPLDIVSNLRPRPPRCARFGSIIKEQVNSFGLPV